MEIQIDGDRKRLASQMQGFHTLVVSGDHTREVDDALWKLGGEMRGDCVSET